MASFNSFSFALEMTMESSSIQLGPRMLLYRQKKAVGCEGRSDLRVGGLSFMWGSQGWGCKRGALRKIEIVKATGKDSVEGEDKEEAEDALQATIEKSKKVLAMQSQLLQQIAERRQIVSSIKSSITDAGDEEVSFKETEVSNVDRGSDGTTESNGYLDGSDGMKPEISSKESENSIIGIGLDNTTEDKGHLGGSKGTQPADIKYSSRTLSSENVYSDASMVSESQTSASHSSSREGRGEGVRDLWQKLNVDSSRPIEDVIELPKKSPSEFDESSDASNKEAIESLSRKKMAFEVASPEKTEEVSAVPNFLLKTAEPSPLTDEKDWDSKQSTTRELSDKVDDPVQEDVKPPPPAGVNVMNVILVAAECAPWSKTGGLGDVAGALPKALARRGHRVMVVAPCYGDYTEPQDTGVRKRYRVDGQDMEVCYFQAYIDGVDFVFIESPMFRHIGNNIYGGSRLDILKRMVLFCKAAVEVPWHVPCGGVCYGDGNLVFIANDWHTALLPVYLKAYCRDNGMMTFTRSVLVIHNIAHQGRGPVDDFSYVDLPEHYLDYFKLYDPIGGDHFNIFAAGLKAADRIVTVSHGYAWELKTSEGGWGLHNIINESNWKLRGIVNGIDTEEWNPQFDVHLKSDGYTNYSLDTLKTGKAQCKAALQKELGLAVRDDIPLIGFIGRLDVQKGVDIIGEAIPWMMGQDVQLVMLGSGRPDLEHMLRQFDSQYHDKIRGWVGFSVKTAHRITAGADILLMPSRFEPCGLNQLYAMSYGTVPVVHAVGGLRDTVQQFDPFNESGVGWTFDRAESNKLINALGNCLLTYREYKKSWEGLQRRGMTKDLSWDNAALQYEEVLVAAKFQW